MHKSISVFVSTAIATLLAAPAGAAFDSDALKCRTTIVKKGSKLVSTLARTLTGCHKSRNKDRLPEATDCNDLEVADTKEKVASAVEALTDAVSSTSGACEGLTPADLGYLSCPVPCAGTITTFDDVGACIGCLATDLVPNMTATALGTPALPFPGGKSESACHGAIARQQAAYLGAILKLRTKCQNEAEQDGHMDTEECEQQPVHDHGRNPRHVEAPDDEITEERLDAAADILDDCQDVTPDYSALDTCESGSDENNLLICVLDTTKYGAKRVAETLFQAFYGLELIDPFTWTEIYALFAGSDPLTNCAGGGCHIGETNGDLNLDSQGGAYGAIVGGASFCAGTTLAVRVVPGDPWASFVMQKLDHTSDCGSHMPLGKDPLDEETRDRIRAWIESGAPND